MGRLILDVPGCQLRAHGSSRSVLHKMQRPLQGLSPRSSGSQQLHRNQGCSQDKWRLIDSRPLSAQNSEQSPICKRGRSGAVTAPRLRAAVAIRPLLFSAGWAVVTSLSSALFSLTHISFAVSLVVGKPVATQTGSPQNRRAPPSFPDSRIFSDHPRGTNNHITAVHR